MHEHRYNSVEGIRASLKSYQGFIDCMMERHRAGYNRKERLREFVVRGLWYLDTCGNFMRIAGGQFMGAPEVQEADAFKRYLKSIEGEDWHLSMGIASLPDAHLYCPVCFKGWTLDNFHDHVRESVDSDYIPGGSYVGWTLKELQAHLNTLRDGVYYLDYHSVRNEADVGKSKRGDGWIDVTDAYVIQSGDELFYQKSRYLHNECIALREKCEARYLINTHGSGYNHFKNLAGSANCDFFIKAELTLAGIDIVESKSAGEVPFHFMGKLPGFSFERAWHYWVVKGDVPLAVAEKMYATDVGRASVRVAGHCGCPPPREWEEIGKNGKVVRNYHIDTLPGLVLFVKSVFFEKEKEADCAGTKTL